MKKVILALLLGCSIIASANASDRLEIFIKIIQKAEKHNVPTDFALAIIKAESNYNPFIRGSHGEYGLGQIKCSTARSMGFQGNCDQLFDPNTNLEYSMKYLRRALDVANNNLCDAATLYNRGIDGRPKPSEYCKRVLAFL